MRSVAQFEEQCLLLPYHSNLRCSEKDRILEPASVTQQMTEEGLLTPELSFENSMDVASLFSPRDVTKDRLAYTLNMNSITVFNQENEEQTSDNAPICEVTANVKMDNDIWSLLSELEASDAKPTLESTNSTDNQEKFDPNANFFFNFNHELTMDDCDMLDDDFDQLFQLSTEIDSADDLSSLSAGSPGESTADLLASVISETVLFINPSPHDYLSDTTLSLGEVVKKEVVEQELSEQVVPNDQVDQDPLIQIVTDDQVDQNPLIQIVTDDQVKPEPTIHTPPTHSTRRKRKSPITESTPTVQKSIQLAPTTTSSSKKSKISPEDRYNMMRIKNNEASKRSRQSRKMRYQEADSELTKLEEDNVKLKREAERLEKAVNELKSALTSTVLKHKV